MKKMIVGLLSTLDNPLLPLFIKNISQLSNVKIIILCDQKLISAKDSGIWNERTNGYFEKKQLSIYDFQGQSICYYLVNHNSERLLDVIKEENIDCLLNAGTPRKLPTYILYSTRLGVLNIHPGALPAYRGCSAVEWAIYNNDPVSNTAHFMDANYDTGAIVKIESYSFSLDDTYVSIRCKVFEASCKLAAMCLEEFSLTSSSNLKLKYQIPSDGKYYSPISNEKFQQVISMVDSKCYQFMS